MRISKLFFPTLKEAPKDASIQSHVLMVRAGLIKKVSSGIYSMLPLGNRVVKKVENIIREEMNRIGGNEFLLPVLIPGDMWKQSDRWFSMGAELFRLRDRNLQDYVLAPTHEEVFTALLKDHIKSYRDLPLTVYHIGPKFRDEIRPRFGVMRSKTFTMKDAYSFHTSSDSESLDATYNDMASAYRKIFQRCGLNTIPVAADSGTMGGSASEEFMVPARVGEEEIVQCSSCGYVANRERAECQQENMEYENTGELELIHTPGVKTISDLTGFLDRGPEQLIKTLLFKTSEGGYIIALVRGDLEVNETKLKNHLGVPEIEKADPDDVLKSLGIPLGFAGPIGVTGTSVIGDNSIKNVRGGVTGANRKDYHYKNVNAGRDFTPETYTDLRLVGEGDRCPRCGKRLSLFRGIELGHIFKLGDKYTRAFDVSYLDEAGEAKTPLMGCYGIGVERTVAAVIEQNHDENGIIWPISISPYHVIILPIKYTGRMKEVSDGLYDELQAVGIETLLDDRELRPGVKFKDADLIGIPYRINIGDKGLSEESVELVHRRSGKKEQVDPGEIGPFVRDKVEQELKSFS